MCLSKYTRGSAVIINAEAFEVLASGPLPSGLNHHFLGSSNREGGIEREGQSLSTLARESPSHPNQWTRTLDQEKDDAA